MGEYVTVPTDGLEELEIFPAVPSLEHYNKSIQREKMKLDMRKKQLGIEPVNRRQSSARRSGVSWTTTSGCRRRSRQCRV